ncbi:MAG TPA: PASTA domain-containing protein [Chitinophagaceae bacterium]|nr:PASTA domain-containing protein [Chitinophagaceae bacterium]
MFKFITDKPLWVNLLVMLGLIFIIFILFFSSLGIITRHSSLEKVPSVVGKKTQDATELLEANGFAVSIQDSVYIDTAAPGSVIRQSPEGDATVKVHRTIYLTVNRQVAPLINMPDLRGFSYKSAELYLQSLGLKVGDTTYTPDIARNAVREQLIGGKNVDPGTKVNMGTAIDLVLGNGEGEDEINVPDLVGMTVADARLYLSNKNLNLSAIIAVGPVSDTSGAFISKQSPLPFSTLAPGEIVANKIRPGQLIDIWISSTPQPRDTTDISQ